MGRKNTDSTYTLIKGNSPTLITAPHAKAHRRPNLSGVLKQEELKTDYIVKSVCEETGSWGMYTKKIPEYDPNFHKEKKNPFKQGIYSLVKDKKIDRLIDIHGLSDMHKFDVGIFYQIRFRRSKDLSYHIAEGLNKDKMRGILIQVLNFKDDSQETIGEYTVKKLRIPAVQIEVARYIRDDPKLLENFIKNLSDSIKAL